MSHPSPPRRAPRPTFENVAANPGELVIELKSPALGSPTTPSKRKGLETKGRSAESKGRDKLVYALVDVSRLDQGRKRVIQRRFNVGVLEAMSERKASTL